MGAFYSNIIMYVYVQIERWNFAQEICIESVYQSFNRINCQWFGAYHVVKCAKQDEIHRWHGDD